jgi:hypothetical protein
MTATEAGGQALLPRRLQSAHVLLEEPALRRLLSCSLFSCTAYTCELHRFDTRTIHFWSLILAETCLYRKDGLAAPLLM